MCLRTTFRQDRAGTIVAMDVSTITAPPWTLGAANATFYQTSPNQHECVRVDLESLTGDIHSSITANGKLQFCGDSFQVRK